MHTRFLLVSSTLLFALDAAPGTLAPQEDDETDIYASYYECAPGSIGDAIQILEADWSPVIQEHLETGHVLSWGAATHTTGNQWSLALYHAGPGVTEVTGAIGASIQRFAEDDPEAGAEDPGLAAAFSETCFSHQDNLCDVQISRP